MDIACSISYKKWEVMTSYFISACTGPRSAVGNVAGNRCESDCRSRGREFDPILSWRLIMK